MRVLIHGINFSPELTGIGKYTGELVEWLVSRGYEVRVVTAPPYYPEWRVGAGYRAWQYKYGQVDGLRIWRCPLWVPRRQSGLRRLVHLASFALSSLPVMLRQMFWKPDVVFVIAPSLMCSPAALFVARMGGGKAWLHVQDFEVDAAFELGILRAAWARRWVSFAERWLMRRFDRVSTISDKMQEKLRSKGVGSNKAILFPNWVDPSAVYPMQEAGGFRRQLGISPDQIVALYSGNMGEKQGLEIVLEAAVRLQGCADVHFVLCGDGAAKARLHGEYEALPNVTWLPLQPVDKLNELLNMADIHMLPQRGDAADLVMPSKLLGMLASGRPILATVSPDTQVATVVSRCGVVTPPGDVAAFAEALQTLAADAEGRVQAGRVGRSIAENQYSLEAVLHRFEHELKRVVHA